MSDLKLFNTLIIGSGGREHALAWKIKKSPILNNLYIAPGNSGTQMLGTNINIDITDFVEIKNVIKKKKIHIIVIGPEEPLVNGLHDQLKEEKQFKDLIIIGPQKTGALLEGSKSFAKKFMSKYKIPTATFKSFQSDESDLAIKYLHTLSPPYVIKADGLAAGKGVYICKELRKAVNIVKEITLESKFGDAGKKIVIESFLDGIELSVFILTNGNDYKILPIAKDYKRIGENDTGLNTGGMGAVSPAPFVTPEVLNKIKDKVIDPTIVGLKKEKIEYIGFIFFGLIVVKGEPHVIEYNVRLGDPETQVILPRIKSDLLELMTKINNKRAFATSNVLIDSHAAATVILTSGGYPETYRTGYTVNGLKKVEKSVAFHAGLQLKDKKHITSGGRVLAITSVAKNLNEAIKISYQSIDEIYFQDMYFRKDIGSDMIR